MASKSAEYMRSYRASAGGVSSFTAHDGHVYDLSGSPLVYGYYSHADMSNATARSVAAFEQRRYRNKVEFAQAIDADGNVVGESGRGGNSRAYVLGKAGFENAVVMTHNHPIVDKNGRHRLGGTFSATDLRWFDNPNVPKMQTIRATTAEGTYSMTKGRNFNYSGMMSHYKSVQDKAWRDHSTRTDALNASYRGGKITYSEYIRRYERSASKVLVDMHNGLRAGQKKYGYTYALERR